MQTYALTAVDFSSGKYIGNLPLDNLCGHLEIAANLGMVEFHELHVKGRIYALAGTGIKTTKEISAGGSISAGLYISAGEGVSAGGSVSAREEISAGGLISAGSYISAGGSVSAGTYISADRGISAGEEISAGGLISAGSYISAGGSVSAREGISAGSYISAVGSIFAGLSISCKLALSAGTQIFAGFCSWKQPTTEETMITCGKLIKGQIMCGVLKAIGLPQEKPEEIVTIDGNPFTMTQPKEMVQKHQSTTIS